jgi:hypothetical protein
VRLMEKKTQPMSATPHNCGLRLPILYIRPRGINNNKTHCKRSHSQSQCCERSHEC